MVESEATLELIHAIEAAAPRSRFEELLRDEPLARMFPAVGVPTSVGLDGLVAATAPVPADGLEPDARTVVEYLQELGRADGPLRSLARTLTDREREVTASAFERTRQYLPSECELGTPRLAFLPLGFDFRTERETVFMDPLASLAYGLYGIRHSLAHELHHVARFRLTGEDLTLMRPEEERPLDSPAALAREWASWLELEGIADCASNAVDFDLPPLREAIRARRAQMAGYADLLRAALGHVRTTRTSPTAAGLAHLRRDLRNLAHPVGARMAAAIEEDLGRPALRDCVGDPRRFLEQYDRAARSKGLPTFEEDLLDGTGPRGS